jgi:lysophospholipase L1-like esterase
MRIKLILPLGLALASCGLATAQTSEQRPKDAGAERFLLLKAPKAPGLVLKAGDRLAICGDSITEQKMYSRIMEDYLTVCAPELKVTVRQYGWSGERAPGFLARMTNDCLLFKPTIATTCYGMNDHEYGPYRERIGRTYCEKSLAVIEAFKSRGVRVIHGSPGCVGKIPAWVKTATGTVEDLNVNLCNLRNLGVEMAREENVGFADVFGLMIEAGAAGQQRFGADYAIAGKDGVHPGWAGHTVMAYAFLKALGLNGAIGTFTADLRTGAMRASEGHQVISAKDGRFEIKSTRYPFCPCLEPGQGQAPYPVCGKDDPTKDDSIRSAMTLIPFNQDLNRLVLVARHGRAPNYKVTWGSTDKVFTAGQLASGVNLAEEFPCNPFCAAFAKVDAAVAAKQAYETKQVKEVLHGAEAKADLAAAVTRTEEERKPLAAAIREAFVPVTHVLIIEPRE